MTANPSDPASLLPTSPAEVFHASQMIADESIARGWSIWDFVERVGTLDPSMDVLAYQLYAATVAMPDELRLGTRVGDTFAIDMERVFGISAEVWERTEALCRTYPDRIAPLDAFALDWFDLNDEEAPHAV